jgi:hypothetical protein
MVCTIVFQKRASKFRIESQIRYSKDGWLHQIHCYITRIISDIYRINEEKDH